MSDVFYFIIFLGASLICIVFGLQREFSLEKKVTCKNNDSDCCSVKTPYVYSFTTNKTSTLHRYSKRRNYSYNGYNNYTRRKISKLNNCKLYK